MKKDHVSSGYAWALAAAVELAAGLGLAIGCQVVALLNPEELRLGLDAFA